jgi:hypothetical protein
MDLSNSEFKPAKQRSNNTFALPTSLNHELSYLNITPSDQSPEIYSRQCQQTSTRRNFLIPPPSQATHTSSYQAIEAAYREHGIRIQLSSTTAAAVSQQKIQSTENLTGRKSANSLQRHKAFVDRNASRSSSALHYSTIKTDLNQDSRPFSALQQTSTNDFEQTNTYNVSYVQPIESQVTLKSSEQLNTHFCSSSIVANEHSNPVTPPSHLAITNGTVSTTTLIDNDPDLAYMSTLLQTTSGDSFRGKPNEKPNIEFFHLLLYRYNSSSSWSSCNICCTSTSTTNHNSNNDDDDDNKFQTRKKITYYTAIND